MTSLAWMVLTLVLMGDGVSTELPVTWIPDDAVTLPAPDPPPAPAPAPEPAP
jgi:hypothetical protein